MPRPVFWYIVYCHVAAAFMGCLGAVCVWFIVRHKELANDVVPPGVVLATGLVGAPLCLLFAAMNVAVPRYKGGSDPWAVHLSNIVLGIGTCALAPFGIALLAFWFRSDVRQWYRRHEP